MPLYLYPSVSSQGKLSKERQPNLAPGLLDKLSAAYSFSPTPEEVLGYIFMRFCTARLIGGGMQRP